MLTIVDLYQHKEFIDIVSEWAYREWHERNGFSLKLVRHGYLARVQTVSIPKCFIVLHNFQPVGMVSLKTKDLETHKEYGPWLSALYIIPQYRSRGIATKLIDYIRQYAQGLQYKELYLFTDFSNNKKLTEFYKKRGWKTFCAAQDLRGRNVNVMRLNLL